MRYIYLDNFRGFKDTIIPLKDVNFLVGENSTGKTSLLALLGLVNSSSFWFSGSPEFDSEKIKLGNFRDIVSVGAKDKSYFRVGLFIGGEEENNESNSYSAYLITFKEKDGMPAASKYTYSLHQRKISVILTSKIMYKSEPQERVPEFTIKDVKELFTKWTMEHQRRSGHYKTLKGPISLLRSSLGALNAFLLAEKILKETGTEKSSTFSFGWSQPFQNVVMLAPIRTRPKKTYDEYNIKFSPGGEHTPYLIKKYFRQKKEKTKFLKYITKFGKDSGLFNAIDIKSYGRLMTSPFELDVAIDGSFLKIVNVGYGISQVLPVVVEIFERGEETCFLIQQPEIHLHPRAQAALGKVFYDLAQLEDKHFVVETHSDFIIDGFRFKYRKKGKDEKPEGQILYFERCEEGNRLYNIDILENGDLPEEQPPGYRDFFVKEQMHMLGY